MFERFTRAARLVVVQAQEEARQRKADEIRTEHLLAAFYAVPDADAPDDLAPAVLERFGVGRDEVLRAVDRVHASSGIDAEALSTIGIDLDEVRRQVEEAFGPGALDRTRAASGKKGGRLFGHIPFEGPAKKALQLALREAIALGHNHIGTEHILLGLLHSDEGAAHHILAAHGVRLAPARAVVRDLVGRREAG
ncbi:MAG TPA: Clp protease N-terminal domain-containing protein [Pseudonocardia sp.]|jgi:ATP-dependent Clp protease ATP-binding subunit ClpA|uniref:Clp protease N-terminal domain-containing protein n=1 Tax=Pseudonocardia sp. TaxID=60912 RepID=UPI002B4B8C6E|nr:Clp protease N-terminal domain-containing protein [Pseudonocardia sp.]HLU59787.1 Clp protease N-terminal domain-containing protein [Pseudonocardia sp.]